MASIKLECIDDAAYLAQATEQAEAITDEAAMVAAVQIALMAARRTANSGIADLQEAVANRRMVVAEELLAHAQNAWVKEKALVQETMAVPVFTAQYSDAQIMLTETDRVEDIAIDSTTERLSRLGITANECDEKRVRRGVATARTDLVSHSMRASEARALMLNERRYSRQLSVAALGRGVLQAAIGMGRLADARDGVSNSLMRTINSGMSLWGYSANRWRHGGNFATGENGPPRVIPEGHALVETTNPTTGKISISVQTNSMANSMEQGDGGVVARPVGEGF